jgi:hypothetical protein
MGDYSREFRPTEWGLRGKLHGSNPEPLMSALGQKRTWRAEIAMSALPPIADIASGQLDVRFGPKADIQFVLVPDELAPVAAR